MKPMLFMTSATVSLTACGRCIGQTAQNVPELGILVWQDFMFGCGQVICVFSWK